MSYYPPASPYDPTRGSFVSPAQKGAKFDEKEIATSTRSTRSNSGSSRNSASSRKARFVEATAVISPAAGPGEHRGPFVDRPAMATSNNDPSAPADFGFSYYSDNKPVEQHATVPTNLYAGGQPLKSALKTPGTARFANPLSPTFREEAMLEREEEKTEKQQAADVVS